jgi:hypothetical protein
MKLFRKRNKPKEEVDTYTPICWTLSWSGTIELGFADGTYLPRRAGLILHPQYFKDGEPILDMLPPAYKVERKCRKWVD